MHLYHNKTTNTIYLDVGSRQTTLHMPASVDVEEVASIVKTKALEEIITQLLEGIDHERI